MVTSPVLGQYEWNNLGPDNLGSITRTLAELPDGRILAGSQGGGLWVSENRGVSWSRFVSYDQAGGDPNVTSIAVNPSTGYIYVATGAVGFRTSFYVSTLNQPERNYDFRTAPEGFKGYLNGLPGTGVWIWNGSSWSNQNATTNSALFGTLNYKGPFVGIQKILLAGNRIFIATYAGVYFSDSPDLAVVLPSQGSPVFQQSIVYDIEKAAGDVVIAGIHNVRENDSLYISTDGGISFQASTAPIFYAGGTFSFGRTMVAVAPSDPNTIYVGGTAASGETNGIFRSTDNGASWERYAPRGGPGFSPLGITGRDAFLLEVFPDNKDELIISGNNWYTFLNDRGWTQTARHDFPFAENYIPRRMYSVLFLDGGQTIFVGTGSQIARSDDRGATFSQKSKGYESHVTYSVASTGITGQDAILAGTPNIGTIYNQNFTNANPVLRQGFGTVLGNNHGLVAASAVFPGSLLAQGSDRGVERSLNSGENFERFYGSTNSPQVAGLTNPGVDTLIDRQNDQTAGGALFDNRLGAQAIWALDERFPAEVIDAPITNKDSIQAKSASLLFFCSGKYLWVANGAFGDALQVKWNRVTNQLVDGVTEFITAMTVSEDPFHTIWIGTSKGKLYRVIGAHDLATFNATTSVSRIDNQATSGLSSMVGRWISDVAVDPADPNRVAITYAGYGGDVAATTAFIWMTQSGISAPTFYQLQPGPKEPMYSVSFVRNNNESVLLLGTERKLYSITGISLVGTQFFTGSWRDELGGLMGNVPIYDIHVRRYKATILDEETLDFRVERDNTVFVATHGRGIWSTTSLVGGREENTESKLPLAEANQVKAYPNPVTGGAIFLELTLKEPTEATITLMSLDGRVVHTQSNAVETSNFVANIPTQRLASGYYLYRVDLKGQSGGETFRGKIFLLE